MSDTTVTREFEVAMYPGESEDLVAVWLQQRFDVRVNLEHQDGVAWPVFVVTGTQENVDAVAEWHTATDPENPTP